MELEMLCFPQLALTECQPGLESFYSLVRRGCAGCGAAPGQAGEIQL